MEPEQLDMTTRTRGGVGVGAVPPNDKRYRYFLDRPIQSDSDQIVCFLMLNPSTADVINDDQTIKRCIRYAKRWGYGWLHVVNLSPCGPHAPMSSLQQTRRMWQLSIFVGWWPLLDYLTKWWWPMEPILLPVPGPKRCWTPSVRKDVRSTALNVQRKATPNIRAGRAAP